MYKHIMVPLDLAEKDRWQKAVHVATDLAKHYDAKMTLVSVGGGLMAKVSHSETEHARQLADYAADLSNSNGFEIGSQSYGSPDPSVEVDQKLRTAIEELGVDLVVMASHKPGWMEYIVNSHGGRLASHAAISVFLVRED